VFLRGLTASLMIGLLGSVAGPLTADASVAAPNARTHAYGLPSDGWKPGQADMEEAFGGPFRAMLTKSGACAWIGSATVLWPAGYRVRFHPTELLDPKSQVVVGQGEIIGFGGQLVGTASWPSASRCYRGGDLLAAQSRPFRSKGFFGAG